MAKTDAPNTSSNQWYFNVIDNSSHFDNRFSVFGMVLDDASQTTIERINNLTIVDADGGGPSNSASCPSATPPPAAERPINIPGDLAMVTRVAMQMDAVRTTVTTGAAPATASTHRRLALPPSAHPATRRRRHADAALRSPASAVSKERVFD